MLPTDSLDYEILEDAVSKAPSGRYLSLEIGTREGGSSEMIMRVLSETGKKLYTHISVDHYGQMPQAHSDQHTMILDYTNEMRNRAMSELFKLSTHYKINYLFFNLDDQEFFDRFGRGIPIYDGSEKRISSDFGFVFLDGPHSTELVLNEAQFFAPRIVQDGLLVFDDVGNYNITMIANRLEPYGFVPLQKGQTKWSLIRSEFGK